MQIPQLLTAVECLASPLPALDATLVDTQPGAGDAAPPYPDLGAACRDLQRQLQAVADAMNAFGAARTPAPR